MKKRSILVSCLLLAFAGVNAQDFVECDEESRPVDQKVIDAYTKYEQQAQKEMDSYMRSVKSLWSGDSVLTDTQDKWVEYSKDFQSRTVVDFQTGEVTVSVVMKPNDDANALDGRLSQALGQLLTSRGTSCAYYSMVDTAQNLSEAPLMEGMIDLSRFAIKNPNAQGQSDKTRHFGNKSKDVATADSYLTTNEGLSDEQNRELAKSVVGKLLGAGLKKEETSPLLFFPRDGGDPYSDGQSCSIVSLQMNMVKSSLNPRAAVYKKFVDKYAAEHKVEKALIYAVMEKESSFNPKATSHCPAYGLMQIVPKTAGLASYRYVYEEDVIPTSSYLYVPKQNVELGVAYLRILLDRFKSVKDPDCRRLCVIVAYNAGAGNVSRSFTGGTNLSNAIPSINRLNYTQLLKHFATKMSSAEARNNVVKVAELREKYLKQLK